MWMFQAVGMKCTLGFCFSGCLLMSSHSRQLVPERFLGHMFIFVSGGAQGGEADSLKIRQSPCKFSEFNSASCTRSATCGQIRALGEVMREGWENKVNVTELWLSVSVLLIWISICAYMMPLINKVCANYVVWSTKLKFLINQTWLYFLHFACKQSKPFMNE